jgi:hypothetical protein
MAIIERSRRVRPAFRVLAIVALVLLLPIAAHTIWDHVEARRLSRIVTEIRSRNEPDSPVRQGSARVNAPQNAARYYDAAAALVDFPSEMYGPAGLMHRMSYGSESERPQLVRDVRAWLDGNKEAEQFLDRATDLPFEGYPPGTGYNYRFDRLLKLARLANLRAFERLEAGDGDRAARAIVQQLRINRALGADGDAGWSMSGWFFTSNVPLRDIPRVLQARASDAGLQQVQRAIRDVDDDNALERSVLAERAFYLGQYWNESRGWYARPPRDAAGNPLWFVMRPFTTGRIVAMIEIMTELLDRARQPWPARIHVEVPEKPASRDPRGSAFLPSNEMRYALLNGYRSRAVNHATALALGRTGDAAIAAEQYRRATGALPDSLAQLVPAYLSAVPIDPYSGREIRYVKTADRTVVYSVGKNETDDGGVKVDYPVWRSGAFQNRDEPPDIGVVF